MLLHGQRQKLWCTVEQGALQMLQDPSCPESLAGTVLLAGCVVTSGADTGQPLLIHLAQHGREVVVLEVRSAAASPELWCGELGRWLPLPGSAALCQEPPGPSMQARQQEPGSLPSCRESRGCPAQLTAVSQRPAMPGHSKAGEMGQVGELALPLWLTLCLHTRPKALEGSRDRILH